MHLDHFCEPFMFYDDPNMLCGVAFLCGENLWYNNIHHAVSLALSSDLFHIMLLNVSGARLLEGMTINI